VIRRGASLHRFGARQDARSDTMQASALDLGGTTVTPAAGFGDAHLSRAAIRFRR
jgi:hypothetical protein